MCHINNTLFQVKAEWHLKTEMEQQNKQINTSRIAGWWSQDNCEGMEPLGTW